MKCPVYVGNLAILQFLDVLLVSGILAFLLKNPAGFLRSLCSSGAVIEVGGSSVVGSHTLAAHSGVSPLFFPQKDLLLSEIPSSTTSLCSRKMGMEKVMAREICQKYLEKRAGRLPEDCAEALAMTACLCLRRRNASLAEVSLTLKCSPAMSPVLGQFGLTSGGRMGLLYQGLG